MKKWISRHNALAAVSTVTAAAMLTACLARKWCSAKLRGIRLFCVSPPNGIAVPTMDDSLRPSMAYPQIVQQGRYAVLQSF